jgi:hypothetical protein
LRLNNYQILKEQASYALQRKEDASFIVINDKSIFFKLQVWTAISKGFIRLKSVVELRGIEPRTPCLQSRCSPS